MTIQDGDKMLLVPVPEGEFILPFSFVLHAIAAISMVGAVALVIKLYRETDKGWYWLCLVLSIVLLALSQWMDLIFPLAVRSMRILMLLSEVSQIAGSVLLIVSFYGMYKTMKYIRKRIE